MQSIATFILFLTSLSPWPAMALCTGATLAQDYRDADVVIRGVAAGSIRIADDEMSAAWRARWGDYSPVELARLTIVETFKGKPGQSVHLFETVDSGRFGVDLGEEYLLFLTYHHPARGRGSAARGAMYVRHACGQSRFWKQVSASDVRRLQDLRDSR